MRLSMDNHNEHNLIGNNRDGGTPSDSIQKNLEFIKNHWDIQSQKMITYGISPNKSWLSRFQNFIHRPLYRYFESIANHQAVFNSYLVQVISQLYDERSQNEDFQRQELKKLYEIHLENEKAISEQTAQFTKHLESINSNITQKTEEFQQILHNYEQSGQANLDNICQRLREIDSQINLTIKRVNEIDNSLKPRISINLSNRSFSKTDQFNYLDFEEVFRGSEDLIKQRQRKYIPFFKGKGDVIDLGSGRGEFLTLLYEQGIRGIGVDSNRKMVLRCLEKKLDVIQCDILQYLESIPDESVDGIFSAQVIEHLPFEKLDQFFKHSYEKLKNEGILIVETINPYNLSAFRCFYLDPSHQKPLFPELIMYLCRSSGFTEISVQFISPEPLSELANSSDSDSQWIFRGLCSYRKEA